jgi:hypothetical protein
MWQRPRLQHKIMTLSRIVQQNEYSSGLQEPQTTVNDNPYDSELSTDITTLVSDTASDCGMLVYRQRVQR